MVGIELQAKIYEGLRETQEAGLNSTGPADYVLKTENSSLIVKEDYRIEIRNYLLTAPGDRSIEIELRIAHRFPAP